MDISNIILFAVAVFFLVNLALGLWAGRKVQDMKDYAVGTRNYSTGALVMTYIATALNGGALFREIDNIFNLGLCIIVGWLAMAVFLPIHKYFFASKFIRFSRCISQGECFEKLYGPKSRIFSGFISSIYTLMWAGMEIFALSAIFENMLHVEGNLAVLASGFIVSVYTAIGGMKSVIYTDIIQFCFLVVAVFFMSTISVSEIGGLSLVLKNISADKLNFFRSDFMPYSINMITMCGIFCTSIVFPPIFQRFIMAKDSFQIRAIFNYGILSSTLYAFFLVMIAFTIHFLYPNHNGENVFVFFYEHHIPSFFKPIVVIGLISFIMSSGDSMLHAVGLSFYYDFLKPLLKIENKDLVYVRLVTLISGLVATILAVVGVGFLRADYAIGISSAAICVPLITGLIGLKPSSKAFWYAATAGIFAFLTSKFNFFGSTYVDYSPIIGALTNAIVFLIVTLKENDWKFIMIHNSGIQVTDYEAPSKSMLRGIINFISIPLHFNVWANGHLGRATSTHGVLFGSFYAAMIVLPYLVWGSVPGEYRDYVLGFKSFALLLCSLLMSNSIWPDKFRKENLAAFFAFTVTYCLPFLSTMMILFSGGAIEYTINAAVTIMLMVLLVNWKISIAFILFGSFTAFYVFKYWIMLPIMPLSLSFNTKYLLVYQIVFGSIVALLFARKNQRYAWALSYKNRVLRVLYDLKSKNLDKLESARDKTFEALGHGDVSIIKHMDILKNFISEKNLDKATEKLTDIKAYLKAIVDEASKYLKLKVTEVPIAELAEQLEETSKAMSFKNYSVALLSKATDIKLDKKLFDEILGYMVMGIQSELLLSPEYLNREGVFFYIVDTKLIYSVNGVENYKREIPAIKIIVSTSDYLEEKEINKVHKKELINPEKIMSLCDSDAGPYKVRRIVDAHYGAYLHQSTSENVIISVILPQNVYAIRPQPLDMEGTEEKAEIWPEAIELEAKFKERLKNKIGNLDMAKIDEAIQIIKKYHAHQTRKSGSPYYIHPISVADILLEIISDNKTPLYEFLQKNQENLILGALLHDILEDTSFHPSSMQAIFGSEVTKLVWEVTKIDQKERERILSNDEAFSKLINQNPLSICIKIADRIHNLQTIDGHSKIEKRKMIAQETLDFFVSSARNIGLHQQADQIEEMSKYIIKHKKIEGFHYK